MAHAKFTPETFACVGVLGLDLNFCGDQQIFSCYKMDGLGHCLMMHTLQTAHVIRENWVCCCPSNNHKKSGE
jgi:hypothetical protein